MTDPASMTFAQMSNTAQAAIDLIKELQARVTDLERSLAHHRQVTSELNDSNHRFSDRISRAIAYLEDEIDGAEESRSRDSTLSTAIGILNGELNSRGVPR